MWRGFLLVGCILLLETVFAHPRNCTTWLYGKSDMINPGQKIVGGQTMILEGVGIVSCADECIRQRCYAINYNEIHFTCEMDIGTNESERLIQQDNDFLFVYGETLMAESGNPCPVDCPSPSECVQLTSGDFVCILTGCADSPPTVQYATRDDGYPALGTVVNYTCHAGYKASWSGISICQSNGAWSEVGTCIPWTCSSDPPTIPDGKPKGDSNRNVGDIIRYECGKGYEFSISNGYDLAYVKCDIDLQWKWPTSFDTETLCKKKCKSFDMNYQVECSHQTTNLREMTCACPKEEMVIYCSDKGEWTTLTLDCNYCKNPPHVANADVSSIVALTGEEVTYECTSGYIATWKRKSKCETDGSWSSVGTCEVPQCTGSPPSVELAEVYISGIQVGDMATYTCNISYPTGDLTSVCKSDGKWSSVSGECVFSGI